MELARQSGTYSLGMACSKSRRLSIGRNGRLGRFVTRPGVYL
ncbi:MAG: hypothetical protein V3T33_08930 [Myxococcota bacterium]